MKVCTDACVFGAWLAEKVASDGLNVTSCLDIGTGTGLLSLMLSQKNNFQIDAIEIEPGAFEQAKENFKNSPWHNRLKIFNADAKEYVSIKKYDLIISNPPFFENDLLSGRQNNNLAKHNAGLTFNDLIVAVKNNITQQGKFAVLLPHSRFAFFEKLANQYNFYAGEVLLIKQTPSHDDYFRSLILFSREKIKTNTSELIIKNAEGNYTSEFISLLKDYYLNL